MIGLLNPVSMGKRTTPKVVPRLHAGFFIYPDVQENGQKNFLHQKNFFTNSLRGLDAQTHKRC